MRIYLIENSDHTRNVLAEFLSDEEHDVVAFKSGTEALRAFRRDPAPIVILDLLLVGCNGLDLLDAIKSEHPETEVIVTTSFPSLESVVEVMRREALDYLVKTEDLFSDISASLQRAEEHRRLRSADRQELQSLRDKVAQLETTHDRLSGSLREPQTGLYSDEVFADSVSAEIARGKRHNRCFSIVLMRLNPELNISGEEFEISAADTALPTLAQSVRERLRKSDLVARYDNHTLSIILPETGREGATLVAESIGGLCIDLITSLLGDQAPPQAILQVGVASFPEDSEDRAELLDLAKRRSTSISSDSVH